MLPKHPKYVEDSLSWEKFRLTFEGGRDFVKKYLKQYTQRETPADFAFRESITYCPAHAKAAIVEIKNSIFERMSDVIRTGGPRTYQDAIAGVDGGVDFTGRNMTSFIGKEILPELLVMRRVGVFVDKAPLAEDRTRAEDTERPYLYVYKAEDILSWAYDDKNRLTSVLLRSLVDVVDENTGLVTGEEEHHKLLRLIDGKVTLTELNKDGATQGETLTLNLTKIPFVIFEMTESLMKDIADYQIGLLNLESSDIAYLIKSNFPFYTEQSSPLSDASLTRQATVTRDADGNEVVSQTAEDRQSISVGATTGRRYPKGTERPGFIHPSPEPMEVSMAKQESMKAAIRQLVQLALTNIAPQRASAESKNKDQQGLEAGLAAIGLELETGENEIAKLWAQYEGEDEPALVAYPDQYSLRSDSERLEEAEKLAKQLPRIPSITAQKAIVQKIAFLVLGRGLTVDQEQKIINEIKDAEIIAIEPETLLKDLEAGLVAAETASKARGYPNGDVAKAKKEHIERLAAIAIAQAKGGGAGAARGIPAGPQDDSAEREKDDSQKADKQDLGNGKAVRGDA